MRLFTAITVPESLHSQLRLLQGGLRGASWRPAENFHITLQFFGEVADTDFPALAEALDQIAFDPIYIRVAGMGTFGRKAPFAVWAAIDGGDALPQLAADCAHAARRAGLQVESRKYTPHITLAYLEGTTHPEAAQWISDRNTYPPMFFEAEQFHLVSSHLGKGPAHYRSEMEFSAEIW